MTQVKSTNIHWHEGDISRDERWKALGARGATVWFTGLSGSGKSTIASALEQALTNQKVFCYRLDGDNIRFGLNKNLGFSAEDRAENIRRIGEVARLMVDAGLIVMTAFISPFRAERRLARGLVAEGEFIEIFVDTPLDLAESRDPKGLYAKARRGELKNFTGIDSPYEPPEQPDLVLNTADLSAEAAAERVVALLRVRGLM